MSTRRIMFKRRFGLFILSTVLLMHCSRSNSNLLLKKVQAQDILSEIKTTQETKAVLLNFWATWCKPCVDEFPMIVDLGEKYESNDLKVYFVSVDWLDDQDKVIRFLKQHDVSGVSFIKNQDDFDFINGISKEWTGAVPFTIVFGKKTGDVVDYWESNKPQERFVYAIEKALNK